MAPIPPQKQPPPPFHVLHPNVVHVPVQGGVWGAGALDHDLAVCVGGGEHMDGLEAGLRGGLACWTSEQATQAPLAVGKREGGGEG